MMVVTVYTAGPGCQRCKATTRRLEALGIAFTEVRIDDFIAEAAKFLGMSTAPIVCVSTPAGERFWDGFRPDQIDSLLTEVA
jgi:glutaredoxin-like protein NrdH